MTERHPRTMKMLLSLGLGLRLRSPFRHSVTVESKRIKHDRRSLLWTIRASLTLPWDEAFYFLGNKQLTND